MICTLDSKVISEAIYLKMYFTSVGYFNDIIITVLGIP